MLQVPIQVLAVLQYAQLVRSIRLVSPDHLHATHVFLELTLVVLPAFNARVVSGARQARGNAVLLANQVITDLLLPAHV